MARFMCAWIAMRFQTKQFRGEHAGSVCRSSLDSTGIYADERYTQNSHAMCVASTISLQDPWGNGVQWCAPFRRR
jgi:hypothetical protein